MTCYGKALPLPSEEELEVLGVNLAMLKEKTVKFCYSA
jgi:hypothetical protein